MYYKPTSEDHRIAREEYINRVPMPSRCIHSVPLRHACMDCEIDNELADAGINLETDSLDCFDPRD